VLIWSNWEALDLYQSLVVQLDLSVRSEKLVNRRLYEVRW